MRSERLLLELDREELLLLASVLLRHGPARDEATGGRPSAAVARLVRRVCGAAILGEGVWRG